MKNVVLTSLVVVALVANVGNSAETEAPNASALEHEMHGFVYADSLDESGEKNKFKRHPVLLVPGISTPFHDIYVGEEVSFPKTEMPQLLPVRLMVGKVELGTACRGVYLMPSPKPNYVRMYWVKEFLPEGRIPAFGRADLEPLYYAQDRYPVAQFGMPRKRGGTEWEEGWKSCIFVSKESRSEAITTPEFKALYKSHQETPEDQRPYGY